MRVLFLNPVAVLGGAERFLLSLFESLKADGLDLHLLAGEEGPLAERAIELGVQTQVLRLDAGLQSWGESGGGAGFFDGLRQASRAVIAGPAGARYLLRVRRRIERTNPDVVHTMGLKMHFIGSLANQRRRPLFWHLQDFIGARAFSSKLLRGVKHLATGAIPCSTSVGTDAINVLPGLPIDVVYNAIDVDHFCPGPGDGRWLDRLSGLPFSSGAPVRVGLVATYARWKGHEVFLEAASRVAKSSSSARFYIVGGPLYRTSGSQYAPEELRELADTVGLAGRVGFCPFQTDPLGVYRSLDVVVHASTRPEPFGLTIAESMACGRATIVSAAGGAAELFTDGLDALGFPPGDAVALAKSILRLVESAELRRSLGEKARKTAVARFGKGRLAGQVRDIYRRRLPSGMAH